MGIDLFRKLAGEKPKYAIKVADKEKQNKCSNVSIKHKEICSCVTCSENAEKYIPAQKCDEKGEVSNYTVFVLPFCSKHAESSKAIEIKYKAKLIPFEKFFKSK